MATDLSSLKLSKDQAQAIRAIIAWLREPSEFITVGGYAGTGKTTLLGVIRSILSKDKSKKNVRVAFASYTGQATQNLQQRLKQLKATYPDDSCSTIHSLMYYQELDAGGRPVGWKRRSKLKYDLIIIDEASMVPEQIWNDLLKFQIPIIAVGDHGQLPPIGDSFNLMKDPKIKLEKIHRQAAEHPILRLATMARIGQEIPADSYGKGVAKLDRTQYDTQEFIENELAMLKENTMLLVGRNKTRVQINQRVRALKERNLEEPVVGDQVVCLKNNYTNKDGPVYNGMIGSIVELIPEDEKTFHATILFPEHQRHFVGPIFREQFSSTNTANLKKYKKETEHVGLFDFGYAVTVHKAQGSQAPKAIVFDESWCFKEDAQRWLYTAITRAESSLYIVG